MDKLTHAQTNSQSHVWRQARCLKSSTVYGVAGVIGNDQSFLNLKVPEIEFFLQTSIFLGSVPASIHGFVRACVVSQFLVQDMTTIN